MFDCLMQIAMKGPELDFGKAATVWGSVRNERLRITITLLHLYVFVTTLLYLVRALHASLF